MNADTLALAVMDDDGWGCAITTEPAARLLPVMCASCFMAGADWGAHSCQGTASIPCFCFCQFDFTVPNENPAKEDQS